MQHAHSYVDSFNERWCCMCAGRDINLHWDGFWSELINAASIWLIKIVKRFNGTLCMRFFFSFSFSRLSSLFRCRLLLAIRFCIFAYEMSSVNKGCISAIDHVLLARHFPFNKLICHFGDRSFGAHTITIYDSYSLQVVLGYLLFILWWIDHFTWNLPAIQRFFLDSNEKKNESFRSHNGDIQCACVLNLLSHYNEMDFWQTNEMNKSSHSKP